ncbi:MULTISPECIES: DUF3426 domain-containing protein [unclassified Herbaspirillum]|uniref:DUF3426 domain-containing protein n=1 Tax=unclassified Herbaspirillum TaxID=2624150 RepID=UPI00114F15F3|nr:MULTISPECIES: DUF3426 domain-containing protein [unclassified Herbaspirillum]MBB5392634.1 putative Zn finger-like uncharacterized protein [Herbaspirillum sp. SJZ102]TQK06271.1 putative Zn finger-like uncharacterized protein [Herbaspirillum sp. SJZ130]TQK12251.1 putative Zn finger-like uncharacterized protein [Herbaspirillum sp. SJZ106]TWC68474.1 putative Zn finger-like uncharacterized protein [Herbaspirillum sp. SJZ099]
MALATQCPHCFTIFRVAGDQLKLRGGLVRCGSCKQVFNGNDYLVEASVSDGYYQPAPGSKAQAAPAAMPVARSTAAPTAVTDALPGPTHNPVPEVNTPAPTGAAPPPPSPPVPAIAEPKVFRSPDSPGYIPDLGMPLRAPEQADRFPLPLTPSDTQRQDDLQGERAPFSDGAPAPADAAADAWAGTERLSGAGSQAETSDENPFTAYERAAGAAASADMQPDEEDDADDGQAQEEAHDDADQPAFVKKAERRERLGRVMKIGMMVLAGIMLPILLLQSAYYWRNQLAVAAPPLRPMLNGMCAALHCTIGLPAEIDRLSLESNELQVVPPNQNIYALSLVLRNRGDTPQAWPHIELTLNNDDEKPVVRRVFRPREYLARPQQLDNGIAGESEQPVKLTFELNDALVSGYRIYLFYP